MADRSKALGWAGVVGPVAFGSAWAIAGAVREGYDPVRQPISRLAETGSSSRPLMTAGIAALAAGFLAASRPMGRALGGLTGLAVAGTALATAGIALTPLDGHEPNLPHGLFAFAGYATLAAAPILAAPAFRDAGRRAGAVASVATGGAVAALLAVTAGDTSTGLFQRFGLTAGHTWVALTAGAIALGRLGPTERAA